MDAIILRSTGAEWQKASRLRNCHVINRQIHPEGTGVARGVAQLGVSRFQHINRLLRQSARARLKERIPCPVNYQGLIGISAAS